jgi:hypothetical protein
LPGANALAYHEKSQLTAVKSFITLALGLFDSNKQSYATSLAESCFYYFSEGKKKFLWSGWEPRSYSIRINQLLLGGSMDPRYVLQHLFGETNAFNSTNAEPIEKK